MIAAAWCVARPAAAQDAPKTFDARYQFAIAGRPVPPASVWLYYFGYGYMDYASIGTIVNGSGTIHVGPELLNEEIRELTSNWPTDVVAIDVPGVGWYRSDEFGDLVGDVQAALGCLGREARADAAYNLIA